MCTDWSRYYAIADYIVVAHFAWTSELLFARVWTQTHFSQDNLSFFFFFVWLGFFFFFFFWLFGLVFEDPNYIVVIF